jgi:eukaryotic-like serine/threonine-protein kinase
MSLSAGTRVGPYEIVCALGAGGMGEVYRARDTKLDRDVALKTLPEVFATDADRLARFQREAKTLASLNHPNIGAILGLEDANGIATIVMELVEGEDLSQRIARGPIPIDEAMPIARQIAEALEAAHEQGIVHRDLKPANIKLRPDGAVKVLDFGLAKLAHPEILTGSSRVATSPTITSPAMTGAGVILGTAAYMSPEQARGKPVDKRADIWAFGAVLYEMLSGQRAMRGDEVADTLAAVLRQDLDATALPGSTPPSVRRLIARCLERDVRQRLRDIGEARIVLTDPTAALKGDAGVVPVVEPLRPLWRRAIPLVLLAIAAAALASAGMAYFRSSPTVPVVTRFRFTPAEGQVFPGGTRQFIAISPDGTQIAYVVSVASTGESRLYIRSMPEMEAHLIAQDNSSNAFLSPVFSPDGTSVAFWSGVDQAIKKVAVSGGAPITVCPADQPFGINWDTSGIVFGQDGKGIMRVSADGGAPDLIVPVKSGEQAHGPQLLPGADTVLFTLATGTALDRWDKATIVTQSLRTGERKTLLNDGSDARYLATGHLVYALGGIVLAVPMDLRGLKVIGGPVPIVEGVRRSQQSVTGAAQFGVSNTGSLVYVPGPVSTTVAQSDLAFIDRSGGVQPLKLPPGSYLHPRVSPDGRHIAVTSDNGKEANVWIHDLERPSSMRQLTVGGKNRFPIWSADSAHVAFQSDREGDLGIFWQRADGSGTAERLTTAGQGVSHVPASWSSKSGQFVFEVTSGASVSLWTFVLKDKKATQVAGVRSTLPLNAALSPDGQWLAYIATEAPGPAAELGAGRMVVEPFPGTGTKYPLSRSIHPVWSHDGREIMSQPPGGRWAVQAISTQPSFAAGPLMPLSRGGAVTAGPPGRRNQDMMADGRILGVVDGGQTIAAGFPQIQVVLNWFEELKAKVPSKN